MPHWLRPPAGYYPLNFPDKSNTVKNTRLGEPLVMAAGVEELSQQTRQVHKY
jgi:hypothetical protein